MSNDVQLARLAALVGEPARAAMLLALGDGRALPAGELAACADITAQTASGHLTQMLDAGLLSVVSQGRHRYYRLATPQVATMLEAVMLVAAQASGRLTASRVDPALQAGRTCYNHLAGRLGVSICDALVRMRCVQIEAEIARITPEGVRFIEGFCLDVSRLHKHPVSKTCIDWSERRHHLGGPVGIALHRRCLELGWVRHHLDSRAVSVTRAGAKGFQSTFGLTV
ncbi:MAG: ArsR/SmtB family transcription factor [Rhodanobacter sp.]